MKRLHTTVGAGMLLLAFTACAGQQEEVGFGGQPPAPAPATPVEPKPEQERTPVPENLIKATSQSGSSAPRVWTQDGGSVVVTNGQEGGCSKVHAEIAEQTDQQVKLVLVNETPEPPGICTMDLRHPPLAVQLDAPLDERTVVLEKRDVKVPRN
ncbi:hypothetical protein [Saccharopolyspora gloriosae]|uniref:hypothetical protein n=1 Tax=Saccharopolyspora gloriosae TaxID=455344 RepID=UPI001FB5DF5A|nr:hypothetical protein [Saccharopolyspora gloriosae]